ncbi:MAG: AmmeMemoRadiSam system protein A, partial [Acidobacteriota bacterium]|nr:AmmeMemoRadiSam system protein A [Acidobacteriota bacterium]
MLTASARATLATIPRRAIAAALDEGRSVAAPPLDPGDPGAAFVSIHVDGALRGCIGTLERSRGLAETVASCAVSAALRDPRFPPMTRAELDRAAIEISVLGEFQEITPADPEAIEIGRHGLYVEHDGHGGLLLPQVATEWKWDAAAFLSQVCG